MANNHTVWTTPVWGSLARLLNSIKQISSSDVLVDVQMLHLRM